MARQWVAAIGTAIYTTTDPTGTWSVAATGLANAVTANPLPVRHGPGYWTVAPQANAYGNFFYSATSDGTWTKKATGANTSNMGVTWVDYGSGYWVAAHAGPGTGTVEAIYTATDPSGSWTAATSSGYTSTNTVVGGGYFNGTWVGVGNNSGIRYATDPTGSWSLVSGPTGFYGYAIDTSGAAWAACGDPNSGTNYVWYGTALNATWSATNGGVTATGQFPRGIAYGVASSGTGYWLLTTYQGAAYYATTPGGTWTATSTVGFTAILGLKYADGIWIAYGTDATSKSTMRWTRNPTGAWASATSFPNITGNPSVDVSGAAFRAPMVRSQAVTRAAVF